MLSVEDAIEAFRERFMQGLAVDRRDVEERVAVLLEARPDVEALVATQPIGITRVFLRAPGGSWRSRYAWRIDLVDAFVARFLGDLVGAAA